MKKQTKLILNSSFLILNFLFTSCYTWFEDKINMDTHTPQTNLKDFLKEEEKISVLDSPEQVIASKGLYSDSVKLNWTPVSLAASYRIERAVIKPDSNGTYLIPEEDDFAVLEKQVYNTTYSDVILTNPTSTNEEYKNRYYYRICAENVFQGLESSEYTDILQNDTEGLGWLLPAPTNLDATKGESTTEIILTWLPVDGALNYIIYRGKSSDGTGMEKIDTILANKTSYVNSIAESDQGTNFYYKVCARLPNGSESAFTTLALGYSLKPGAPTAPSGITVKDGKGESTTSLTVKWDAVPKPHEGTLTYALYRTSSEDNVYTLVKNNIPQETTTCTVTDGLKPGLKYYFYMQSIIEESNGDKNKSAFSKTGPSSPSPAVGFLLSAPSDVELADSSSSDKIYVRWTPAVGYDLLEDSNFSYKIYFDEDLSGSFSEAAATISSTELTIGTDGYFQYETNKHNFFKVSTVNSANIESLKSIAVAPTPSAPTQVTATKTAGGELLDYSPNTNEVYPVKITWSKPSGEDPSGYLVYRSTNPTSSFRKLTETPITDTFFIDENEIGRAGTIYYYKVVSVNILGQGKKGNDPSNGSDAQGYGALTRSQWFREYNKTIMKSQSKLKLMHKSNDMDKLGSETINGDVSGTLSYNAAIAGLGAEITMHYENYCDFTVNGSPYYVLTGNTDTTSNMSANGNMHEKVNCSGMYPGYAVYNNLQIKGGAAGGGYYLVETYDLNKNQLFSEGQVSWTVGEEH